MINSRGSHAGNNAQQIASLFSRSPQAGRAKNLPSHYDLLLITRGLVKREALHLLGRRACATRCHLPARPATESVRGRGGCMMSRQRVDPGQLATALPTRSTIRLRVLSLGAGVQSTTLALLAAHGIIDPMPDCTVFADTGWKPTVVYDHLASLTSPMYCPFLSASYRRGDIRENSDQRRSRPARGIHPRACREPASPLRFSPGFSSRQCRDPIRGLTELPSRGRVPALTCRRSIERTSLPSAVSSDRPALTPDGEAARSFIFSRGLDQRGLKRCEVSAVG